MRFLETLQRDIWKDFRGVIGMVSEKSPNDFRKNPNEVSRKFPKEFRKDCRLSKESIRKEGILSERKRFFRKLF